MKVDLVLLHPPSIYNFREKPILWGPINDLVPSTPVFEMYPMGFVSIASALEKNGYRVGIVNIALRMLTSENFQPEEYLSKIDARLYGIDLHWLPHVHGALNLARAVKSVHPEKPLVLGGLSASYFSRELLQKVPEVDFVLRGDSIEKPIMQLMEALRHGNYEGVENLSYREGGRVRENPLSHVPSTLDEYCLDYEYSFRAFMHSKHVLDILPFREFMEKPIMPVLTRKGCESNCIACGGSSFSYRLLCNRRRIAFRSPGKVVEDIKKMDDFKIPAFVIGDIALGDEDYGMKILKGIREEGVDNPLIFEFFYPPPKRFLVELGRSVPRYTIEMSPEAGDEGVRKSTGKGYNNNSLKKVISRAFSNGCSQFDLYFMIGLAFQDRRRVDMNAKLARQVVEENPGKRLLPFISPYAPFIDPGSLAFEQPESYGYQKYASTLLEHYELLDRSITWKEFMNYSTSELSRKDIVELAYSQALDFAGIKREKGLIDRRTHEIIEQRIDISREMVAEVDRARAGGKDVHSESLLISLEELKEKMTVAREELDWGGGAELRRMLRIARKLLRKS